MDLHFTVSSQSSYVVLSPMLRACVRCGCSWQVFLTHHGVNVLLQEELAQILIANKNNAIACHDSWQKFHNDSHCPVTLGSQTNHSEMVSKATRVVSL